MKPIRYKDAVQLNAAFWNPDMGETVADGFVQEKNVVIMMMDHPVTPEELVAATYFHINNRRRIVWVFEEEDQAARAALAAGPDLNAHRRWYSVCACRRDEPERLRRVIGADERWESLTWSSHAVELAEGVDVEDFFRDEAYWQNHEAPAEVDLAMLGAAGKLS